MRLGSFLARVAAAIAISTSSLSASETRMVEWADLIDQSAQVYEDPYRNLTYDQLENLREFVIETARIDNGGLNDEEMAFSQSRVSDAKELLAEDGIDVDWLVAQRWVVAERREKAATAANPDINGETVTLAGFAIPAPADETGTSIVYLVPERGMCSHMPPPNANQMIRARISNDWRPVMMHEPVRLTGELSVETTEHQFRIVDGEVPMRASYVLEVTQVETMKDLSAKAPATNDWAASIAERLRASGQLPGRTTGDTD